MSATSSAQGSAPASAQAWDVSSAPAGSVAAGAEAVGSEVLEVLDRRWLCSCSSTVRRNTCRGKQRTLRAFHVGARTCWGRGHRTRFRSRDTHLCMSCSILNLTRSRVLCMGKLVTHQHDAPRLAPAPRTPYRPRRRSTGRARGGSRRRASWRQSHDARSLKCGRCRRSLSLSRRLASRGPARSLYFARTDRSFRW